jgi:flavoprotein hydroxylase
MRHDEVGAGAAMLGEMVDVVIVGAGPVGQLAAILLGSRGRSVAVVERWPAPYPLPRGVTFDHEIARLLAGVGLAEDLGRISEAAWEYEWRNAAGQLLLRFAWDAPGSSGWPKASMFSQPDLERLLAARMAQIPCIRLLRGVEAVSVVEQADRAEVLVRTESGESRRLHASYVIGCDGANSTVRGQMATSVTDLGFAYDWLIVDVVPAEQRAWSPENLQICDPARPSTVVSGGPGRRRFEFMRLENESVEELNRAETAWKLVAPFGLDPSNARLERHAVYTFQARWADSWREGRILLAGDAAHLMPPFAGQGMCAGLRDAANLAWKLDLVLSGIAPADLLDTYTPERASQVKDAIAISVELGKVICILDPEEAAERDRAMLVATGGTTVDNAPATALTTGLIARRPDGGAAPLAGMFSPQGVVKHEGRAGLFDQVLGSGFVVAALFDPRSVLGPEQQAFCDAFGARLIHLTPHDEHLPGAVTDLEGTYHALLAEAGCEALVMRPDYYLYGAATADELAGLVEQLRADLTAHHASGAQIPDTAAVR